MNTDDIPGFSSAQYRYDNASDEPSGWQCPMCLENRSIHRQHVVCAWCKEMHCGCHDHAACQKEVETEFHYWERKKAKERWVARAIMLAITLAFLFTSITAFVLFARPELR